MYNKPTLGEQKTNPMNKKVNELQALMEKEFTAYCERNGNEASFSVCEIQYKDDKSTLEVTVMMASGSEDDDDEDIFYYCNSFSGLKDLTNPDGMEDFYITDFFYFC